MATTSEESSITFGSESPSYAAIARLGKASAESTNRKNSQKNQEAFPPLPTPSTPTRPCLCPAAAEVAVPHITLTQPTPRKSENATKEDDKLAAAFFAMQIRSEAAGWGNSPFLPKTPTEYMQLQDRFRAKKLARSKKLARAIEDDIKAGSILRLSRQALTSYRDRGIKLELTVGGDFEGVRVDTSRLLNDWPRDRGEKASFPKQSSRQNEIPGAGKCLYDDNLHKDPDFVHGGLGFPIWPEETIPEDYKEIEQGEVNGWLSDLISHMDTEDL